MWLQYIIQTVKKHTTTHREVNKMADFSFKACYNSVVFEVEKLHGNPFTMLGEYIVRAEQDKFFNKTMIEAVKQYIKDNNISWEQCFDWGK